MIVRVAELASDPRDLGFRGFRLHGLFDDSESILDAMKALPRPGEIANKGPWEGKMVKTVRVSLVNRRTANASVEYGPE